jgi:hypothetical protein
VGSIERTPSRRLAPAGAVGIERGSDDGDSVARARARGEGEGATRRQAGSEQTIHLVGFDQVGWHRHVGQGANKWAPAVSCVLFL